MRVLKKASFVLILSFITLGFCFAETPGEGLDRFIDSAKKQMSELDRRIEVYSKKIERMTDKSKKKAERELVELKKDKASLQKKLDGLNKEAKSEWRAFKEYFKATYDRVSKKVEKAIE